MQRNDTAKTFLALRGGWDCTFLYGHHNIMMRGCGDGLHLRRCGRTGIQLGRIEPGNSAVAINFPIIAE